MKERDFINQDAARATEESQLNKPITLSLLLTYGLPTIFALVVMGTFGIVDGVFAMRVLGAEAMAAVSAFAPFFMIVLSIGAMFAGGGSVVVVKKIGMGLKQEARQNFTLISMVAFAIILSISVAAFIFPDTILGLLGANYEILDIARYYFRITVWSFPLMAMGTIFNQFIIADGKPMLGMGISLLGSVISAGLNAVFLFVFEWGIEALAWATVIGTAIPAVILFLIFCNNRNGTIYFVAPQMDIKAIGLSILNGTGALIPLLASAMVTVVMNNTLVRMDGIGAMGIAVAGMVTAMITTVSVVFGGYLQGTMPLVSYNYGNANHGRQKLLFKYNIRIVAVLSVILTIGTIVFADLLMRIYLPPGTELHDMAVRGLRIMTLSFVVSGFNGFAGALFAALNKGAIGGILSTVRAFAFNLPLLLLLPRALDLDGVWLATPAAEGLTIILSITLLLKLGKRYHYLG
ncbi:MAG: MATE family efflux transporter [Oscillospiraceae bacterium]|nr:MATE family efflux transporter [Oscillospiraceae bacterium]